MRGDLRELALGDGLVRPGGAVVTLLPGVVVREAVVRGLVGVLGEEIVVGFLVDFGVVGFTLDFGAICDPEAGRTLVVVFAFGVDLAELGFEGDVVGFLTGLAAPVVLVVGALVPVVPVVPVRPAVVTPWVLVVAV